MISKKSLCLILLLYFVSINLAVTPAFADDDEVYAGIKKKKTVTTGSKTQKKTSEIDLEAIDIQGLIDRPQTLYILKKSKIDFYDTIDENNYVKSIVESTHKAPF